MAGIEFDDGLHAGWQQRVLRARAWLSWDNPPLALPVPREVVVRRHATGTSLAIAAPFDQLDAATEINEWALCAALLERDPGHWSGLQDALQAVAAEHTVPDDGLAPPVLDEGHAMRRFVELAAHGLRADLRALIDSAESRGVRHVLDDSALTLGAGAGGMSWPLTGLPSVTSVPWDALHEIPLVAVASAGDSTTARLIADCARLQGWTPGCSRVGGVLVGRERVETGDSRGPAGARRVLRDPRVQVGVLETSAQSIQRHGLAIDHANVAVVPGGDGDGCDPDGSTDARLVLAQLVARDGLLVLGADDERLRGKATAMSKSLVWLPPIGWSSADYDHPVLVEHRAARGSTCGVRAGRLLLNHLGAEHDLGAVEAMTTEPSGASPRELAGLAAGALAAVALRVPAAIVARACVASGTRRDGPD